MDRHQVFGANRVAIVAEVALTAGVGACRNLQVEEGTAMAWEAGNDRGRLLMCARATEVIGKKLLEVALVYTLLLGVLMLFIVAAGSC